MAEYDREWVFKVDPSHHRPWHNLAVRVCSICKALVEEDQLTEHLAWHAEMELKYGG
jgi:hypothetical protein